MVPCVDDLRHDGQAGAVEVRGDLQLAHVESQLVELLDPGGDPPALVRGEPLAGGECFPQLLVAGDQVVTDLDRIHLGVEHVPGLQIHQLADDVGARQVEVVVALTGGELLVQGAGLDVDEVGGEGPGVAAEERVGQGDVAPVEAFQVQAHQQHRERVEQAMGGVRAGDLAEHGPVGERELQMARDQDGIQLLARFRGASGDHGEGLHRGDLQAAQHPQHVVLALREGARDLLDGEDPSRDAREAHDVAGDAAGEGGEDLVGPLLERRLPRQVQQCRICAGRGDLQGCHGAIVS